MMPETSLVPLPIDRELVPLLQSPATRDMLGQIASSFLRGGMAGGVEGGAALIEAIGRLKVDAHVHGLTDGLLSEELTAYNSEGRG